MKLKALSYSKEWRSKNLEYAKQWDKDYYAIHKKEILFKRKLQRIKTPQVFKERWNKYYKNNRREMIERSTEYYKNNKEKVNAHKIAYRKSIPEKVRQWKRKDYIKHRKEYLIKSKEWRKTETGKVSHNNSNHKRRAKYGVSDIDTGWLKQLKQISTICPLCGITMNDIKMDMKQKTLDHIEPLNPKVCGLHTKNNVRYICRLCNSERPKDGSDLH